MWSEADEIADNVSQSVIPRIHTYDDAFHYVRKYMFPDNSETQQVMDNVTEALWNRALEFKRKKKDK